MLPATDTPLSRAELATLTTDDLGEFGTSDLLTVTSSVAKETPHPNRPLEKWKKCLGRTQRIAEEKKVLRKNVLRLLRIAKLPTPPVHRKPHNGRHHREPFSVPDRTQVLRGGLNHDGPLIPQDIADKVLPPPLRSVEVLFDSLSEDL